LYRVHWTVGGRPRLNKESALMHPELVDYLKTMITPTEAQGITDPVFVYATTGSGYDWGQHEDDSVHGIVLDQKGVDAEALTEIMGAYRVLKPGGHLMLANPDDDLTGYVGACHAEDGGFEVRDCILVPDQPGDGDYLHYVAKSSRAEREAGLDHLPEKVFGMSGGAQGAIDQGGDGDEDAEAEYDGCQDIGMNRVSKRRNIHPTAKAVGVMERLLLDVPKDQGPIVDPFLGSGTTLIAAIRTGHDAIGIEREEEYLTIAEGRIRYWNTAEAGWNAAKIESDLATIEEALDEAAEPDMMSLDDLFGL